MPTDNYNLEQNPLPINRLERGQTKASRRPVINLYGGVLHFPVLVIPEHDFGLLLQAGINPSEIAWGETYHVNLLAYWAQAEDPSGRGGAYRNATKLVDNDPEKAEARKIAEAMLAHSRKQTEQLETITIHLQLILGLMKHSQIDQLFPDVPDRLLN